VVRSWLFAAKIGELQKIDHDGEVLAIGTLLHDITLNNRFNGLRRFEVEGADLARNFASERGLTHARAQLMRRWSMLDVFGLALAIFLVEGDYLMKTEVRWGALFIVTLLALQKAFQLALDRTLSRST